MQLPVGGSFCSCTALMLWLLCCSEVRSQGDQGDIAAEQFFQSAVASNYSSRLVYRTGAFVESWNDPNVRCVNLENEIVIDEAAWRAEFADTGGVAKLSSTQSAGSNLTISSDCLAPAAGATPSSWQTLDFQQLPNAILVDTGSLLTFRDILIADIAPGPAYQYSPAQPWRNAGVGFPMWPTVALGPNATLIMRNVDIAYSNPARYDTCEQYNQKVLYGLQQQYGIGNVSLVNATAGRLVGPVVIPVLVLDGRQNHTTSGTVKTSNLTDARALFTNVTFACLPPRSNMVAGLGTGPLVAAIVTPVIGALLLLGVAAWWLRRRRHRQQGQAANKTPAINSAKDLEMGTAWLNGDLQHAMDQDMTSSGSSAETSRGGVGTSGSPAQRAYSRVNSDKTENGSVSPLGGTTPMLGTRAACTAMHSSEDSNNHHLAGVCLAAATGSIKQPLGELSAPSSLQLHSTSCSASSSTAARTARLAEASSYETATETDSRQGSLAIDAVIQAQAAAAAAAVSYNGPGICQASMDDSASGRYSSCGTPAGTGGAASTPHSTGGTAGGQLVSRRSTDSFGPGCGNSGGGSTGQGSGDASSPAATLSGTSGTTGTAGTGDAVLGSRSRMASRSADSSRGVPALLKARSDMAVLRDLKIGPLLGRGSYGRVYKGRWKSVTVAVKIIEHNEETPGTASSGGQRLDIGRESLLATSIAHPNVVQTYHISTMTISQRNALASAWLQEGNSSSNNLGPGQLIGSAPPDVADVEESDASTGSTESSSPEQNDVLETWMLMEFCEKGSLERAIGQGKFMKKDGTPDMVGIYKALLDTASGLDYLHSIGVVHGDLKTANVLLKGSARDVRGFACKITDFGLSRVLDLDATHISTRTYGTITYMPSELLLTGRMTQATDIYSFGLMMWELYTSTRVFDEGLSIGQIFYMIAYQGWRPHVPTGCPPGFAALMAACWHQVPEQRPTVQQLLRALQKLYLATKQAVAAANRVVALPAQAVHPATAARMAQAGNRDPSRISQDSQASDQYQHAAGGDRGRHQWSYPGQQQQDFMACPVVTTPTDTISSIGAPGGPGCGVSASAAGAPAAAGPADSSSTPDRVSFQSSAGCGSSGSSQATAARPSSEMGHERQSGSGSGDVGEQYQPWARAVSMHPLGLAGTDLQPRRQPSIRLGQWLPTGSEVAPLQQAEQQQHQQQLAAQHITSIIHCPAAGYSEGVTHHLRRQQQAAPQPPVGRYHPSVQLIESEIQPAVDNEEVPSASLYQNASSTSNLVNSLSGSVLFSNNEEDPDLDTDVSGFLHMIPRSSGQAAVNAAQQQSQQHVSPQQTGVAVAAAQGFVEALTVASGSAAAAAGSPAGYATAGTSNLCSIPYHYQQRPIMLQAGNLSAAQGRLSEGTYGTGWGTVSTDMVPSVVGDDLMAWPTGSSLGYTRGSGSVALPGAGSSTPSGAAAGDAAASSSSVNMAGPTVTHAAAVAPQPGSAATSGFQKFRAATQHLLHQALDQQQQTNLAAAPRGDADPDNVLVVPLSAVCGAADLQPILVPHQVLPQASASPFAQQAGPARPALPPAIGVNVLRRSRTPERSTTPERPPVFIYRTPSGRVFIPNPTTGVPQTVREGSGTTTATSGSGPDTLRMGSVASTTVSLYPAGPTVYGSLPEPAASANLEPLQLQQQVSEPGSFHQEQQLHYEQQDQATGPPPSPFAALAQRAGSLFGPM